MMQLFIFKTDIHTLQLKKAVASLFNELSPVLDWNIDLQDIDKVLRIEANEHIQEIEIIHLLQQKGFTCEPLND